MTSRPLPPQSSSSEVDSRLARSVVAVAVSLVVGMACAADPVRSGHRSGELVIHGLLPSQTKFLDWGAMLRIDPQNWCVSNIVVGEDIVGSTNVGLCQLLPDGEAIPTAVVVGESSYGTVFVIYAPGREAVGYNGRRRRVRIDVVRRG